MLRALLMYAEVADAVYSMHLLLALLMLTCTVAVFNTHIAKLICAFSVLVHHTLWWYVRSLCWSMILPTGVCSSVKAYSYFEPLSAHLCSNESPCYPLCSSILILYVLI